MNIMIKLFNYLILVAFLFLNCNRENDTRDDSDCENMMCTEVFVSVNVLIRHSNDNSPVTLTNFKVIRVSDNKDLTTNDNDLTDNNGYYTIVNDNTSALIKKSTTEVEFQGFINSSMVVQKRFTVGMDCCHVSLISDEPIVSIL